MFPKFDKVCRTCLASDPSNDLISIFNLEESEAYNNYITFFPEIIESLTNTMPEKFDGLPEVVCLPCCNAMKNIHFFKMKCINSESVLRKVLMQTDKESVMPSNDVAATNDIYHEENPVYKVENNQDLSSTSFTIIKCEEPDYYSSSIENQTVEEKPGNMLPEVNHRTFENNESHTMEGIVIKEEKEESLNYELGEIKTEILEEPNTDIDEENQSLDPTMSEEEYDQSYASDVKPELSETNTNEGKSLKVQDKKVKKNKSNLECPKCHKSFMHLARLKRHIKTNTCVDHIPSNGKLIFACLTCGKAYNRQFSLQRHCLASHKQVLTKDIIAESKEFHSEKSTDAKKEDGNPENTPSSPIQTKNNEINSIEAMRQCNICKEIFKNDEALAEHKVLAQKYKLHHTEKPHICDICQKGFSYSHNLKIHLMTHKEIKPFKCEQCNQRFVRNSCLNRHLKTHTGDRPFSCEFCSKRFPFMFALKIHERSHTGERPYSCTICSMKFKFANTLKDHQRIHTGEKPHACKLCPRKLSSKANLRIHMRTHENKNENIDVNINMAMKIKKEKNDVHENDCGMEYRTFMAQNCVEENENDLIDNSQSNDYDTNYLMHSTENRSQTNEVQSGQITPGPDDSRVEIFSIMEIEDTNIKKEPLENQGLKKNQCWVCQKVFRGKCLLEIHMRVHTGEKPFNCKLCGKNFRQKAALKTHLLNHTKIKPFKCDQCERAFAAQKDLTSHSLIHSCERRFHCEICNRSFISEKTLKYHRARHTRGYPFGCDICEMRFCYMHLLRRHMLTHTGEKPYKCKYCDKGFRQRHESVVHMQTHPEANSDKDKPSLQQVLELISSLPREGDMCESKDQPLESSNIINGYQFTETESPPIFSIEELNPNDEEKGHASTDNETNLHNEDIKTNLEFSEIKVKQEPMTMELVKKFICKCCGARFALQNTLSHHVRQNKCSQEHFTCPNTNCNRVFASQDKLDAHVLTHTYCDLCGQSFSSSEEIEAHKAEQHNLKVKHPCPHPNCNKAFYKGGQLEKHIETHNIKKEFQCTLCDKSFHRKFYLTQHMNRHTKTRPFKCEQCSKAFYSSGELQRHIMRHTGDRPFPCDICEKTYPLASELRVHKQSHSGERPFACEFCPMRFGFANVLRKHLITHTGERSFKCNTCGRGFVHKQNCEDHMKTHSGEKEYGCEICEARYYTKDSLRKHMRKNHKNITLVEDSAIETMN
ncbi:zinc finger protein 26-like [Eupeodes corollae]|uniref:zinc finger protein 26-like n=1 Tax=Eupeodes corollae TaxID=290404 RepID=UPI002490AAC8|nr:zinc finger protein 26-like [Eupeodes corollae]